MLACAQPSKSGQPAANAHTTHGGVPARLGPLSVEVVVHASGELHVHLLGGRKPTGLALTVSVPDAEGHRHAVAMHFADAVQGFVGRTEEGTPAPGTVELLLVDGERPIRAQVELERLVPAPRHGGSVVVAGEHVVEVVVGDGSQIVAYLRGATSDGARVTAVVPGEDGAGHPALLEPDGARYRGRIEGLTPRSGPLEVLVEREGRVEVGRGTLSAVGEAAPDEVPTDFQLEFPELGSHLPAVIPVPPAEEEAEGG